MNERSMLIVTALSLGMIITWLIATDPSNPGASAYAPSAGGHTLAKSD